MDCKATREQMDVFHKPVDELATAPNMMSLEAAMEHMSACSRCRLWFAVAICARIKDLNEEGNVDPDVYVIHGMLHSNLEEGSEQNCPVGY